MKKMTFALACASTLALFAVDPINKVDFEGYTLPFTVGGLSKAGEAGDGATKVDATSYWLLLDGESDASTVRAYSGAEGADENALAVPTGSLSGTPGDKYLELSTEGGTLWRSIKSLGSSADLSDDTLGAPQPVGDGLYIDMMVQFTPTEDGTPPELEEDGTPPELEKDEDKLAIWLDVDMDNNTTNLMVKCGSVNENYSVTEATFALTGVDAALDVQPGQWYRLTVKAIPDIFNELEGGALPAFCIYLDGQPLKCAGGTNPYSESFISQNSSDLSVRDDINAGKIFPSLVSGQGSYENITLQAVGFKGSGAIDDLVFTDTIQWPSTPTTYDFTITVADGVTVEWSTDGEKWEKTTSGSAAAGNIQIRLTNADGAVKTVTAALSADTTAFNYANETFGWAEYLGAAIENAYVIDDAAEMVMFYKGWAAGLATENTTFELGANIALTAPWAGIGVYKNETTAFKGTFDGKGYTISSVTFAASTSGNNYRGFFNQTVGATIKNLTVEGYGFGANPPSSGEYGCALIVGAAYSSTIENCTSKGTIASGTHNVGGIVVRIKDTTVKGCRNEANLTGNYSKVAGIVVLCQNSATGCTIENCMNTGAISASGTYVNDDSVTCVAGTDGVAGIIAYTGDAKLTIRGCGNTGVLTAGEGAKVGQFVGFRANALAAVEGTNTGRADTLAVGDKSADGLNYATVADKVATYVKDADLAAGGTYLVTAKNAAPVIALATGELITFDTSLASLKSADGITASATTDEITSTVIQNGVIYTAAAKATEKPLNPGQASTETFESEQAAQDAISGYTAALSKDDVDAGMPAEALKLVVKQNGDTYQVVADLNPDVVRVPTIEADAAANQPAMTVTPDTDDPTKSVVKVNVETVTKGVWYGFASGESLDNLTNDVDSFKRAPDENGVQIESTKKFGSSGFFRVMALPAKPTK